MSPSFFAGPTYSASVEIVALVRSSGGRNFISRASVFAYLSSQKVFRLLKGSFFRNLEANRLEASPLLIKAWCGPKSVQATRTG
jgi:hypothetical protein